jgi:universal stress protein A
MKRFIVVCPADLSGRNRGAVAQAAAVAGDRAGELHLLYVRSEGAGRPPPANHDASVHPVLADALRCALAEAVAAAGPRVRVASGPRGQAAERAIASYARRVRADLIVVDGEAGSTRGWRGRRAARRLGRLASCPVLVTPIARASAVAPLRPSFSDVLCAVDLGKASMAAVRAASAFSRRYDARMTLFHAIPTGPPGMGFAGSEAGQVARETAERATAARGALLRLVPFHAFARSRVERIVASGVPHRGILHAAAQASADLVVLGIMPRTGLDEVLNGSTSRAILRRARCPVLLVPASDLHRSHDTGLGTWARSGSARTTAARRIQPAESLGSGGFGGRSSTTEPFQSGTPVK